MPPYTSLGEAVANTSSRSGYRRAEDDGARRLRPKAEEALLHQLQKAVTDRVLTAPIFQQAFLCGVGPRVEESGAGLIQGFPYSGPAEDLKLKP